MANIPPNITTPILRDDLGETLPNVQSGLGPLLGLVGNWNSPMAAGSQLGYNVMPLPQDGTAGSANVILRDFHYYEEMTFSAIPGDAANRGGDYQQNCWVLFYEQRVYFGSDAGPAANTLVHAENGDWLHLVNVPQMKGINENMGDEPLPNGRIPQPAFPIVKQVSVPHGNSILAVGNSSTGTGAPPISEVNTIPTGSGVNADLLSIYNRGVYDPENLMLNPNYVLQQQITNNNVGEKAIVSYTQFNVSSKNGNGDVRNILFERKKAKVTDFHTTFWLEKLADGTSQLQYSQTIEMTFIDNPNVTFYHIDANTLTKVPALA
jgi:hypothetical protein